MDYLKGHILMTTFKGKNFRGTFLGLKGQEEGLI